MSLEALCEAAEIQQSEGAAPPGPGGDSSSAGTSTTQPPPVTVTEEGTNESTEAVAAAAAAAVVAAAVLDSNSASIESAAPVATNTVPSAVNNSSDTTTAAAVDVAAAASTSAVPVAEKGTLDDGASIVVDINAGIGIGSEENDDSNTIQQPQPQAHPEVQTTGTKPEQQQQLLQLQQQQYQEAAAAANMNITTTSNPVIQEDATVLTATSTTANPIAPSEDNTSFTPNPVIPVTAIENQQHQHQQTVQLRHHDVAGIATVEQMQMAAAPGAMPVSIPTLPPISHRTAPANPIEASGHVQVVQATPDPVEAGVGVGVGVAAGAGQHHHPQIHQQQVQQPILQVPAAAAPSTLDFHMDVDETSEPVPALPALNVVNDNTVPGGTITHAETGMGTSGANPNLTANDSQAQVQAHTPVVAADDAAAIAERQEQEAIAAAVVAAQQHQVPVSSAASQPQQVAVVAAAASASTKPARKRGWVKKTWEERLDELKNYKVQHGHCNVPTICKANPSLGHWVHDQRKQYRLYQNNKQTSMNPLRIAQLEEVGFKWALQRHSTMRTWAERFSQLMDFKKDHGHCNVPIRYKINPSLGQWVSTQRQEYSNYRNGKKSNMSDERIRKLEEVEFCWSLRDTAKMAPRKSWDMHFAALKEFREANGHCDVRVRSKQNPTGSLGRWVEKQRGQYHSRNEGRESKLTKEQIDKLDSIGFKWRIRHERNKISGCARNPELKLGDEELMDDYTKRKLDEEAKELALAQQEQAARAQALSQRQSQTLDQNLMKIDVDQAQQIGGQQQMNLDSIHQTNTALEHMNTQPQIVPNQMEGQMEALVTKQVEGAQMHADPMETDNHVEEAVVAAAIEPMSIEAAAAVAVAEAIPVESPVPMVHEPVPAPVPVPLPISEHEDLEQHETVQI